MCFWTSVSYNCFYTYNSMKLFKPHKQQKPKQMAGGKMGLL